MCEKVNAETSAIFVDVENIVCGEDGVRFDITQVMARVNASGTPVLRKAYGNWGRFAAYRHDFINEAFDQVQLFSVSGAKNGLDIQLAVDALESIFLFPHIETVYIISGDSDFCPLVRTLRKHGRRVVGIGWLASTGKALRQHCDDFWLYDEMVGVATGDRKAPNLATTRPLIRQVAQVLGPGEWIKMSTLKDAMLQHQPAFDEEGYGFSSFSQFVNAHPDLTAKFSKRYSDYLVQLPGSPVERHISHINGNSSRNGVRGNAQQKSEVEQLLACFRKRKMQFLDASLQDRVLRALHGVLTSAAGPLTRQDILNRAMNGSLKSLIEKQVLSKTKISGVLQIVYLAHCFEFASGLEETPMTMALLPEFRTYELLKRAHNSQLMRTALACGLDLSPDTWSEMLFDDSGQRAKVEELLEEVEALEVV